jgi:hypothetical protein
LSESLSEYSSDSYSKYTEGNFEFDNLFDFELDNLFDNVFEPEGNFWYCCSGGQYTRGNQCICNCLVFLALTSYKINNKNVDLDYILETGDQIYMKTIQNLKKTR